MSCNSECEPSDCLVCLSMAIENQIFEGIQMEQEGESDEEWYQEFLDVIRHDNIDDYIEYNMYHHDCEYLVHQYGINKAFKKYKDRLIHQSDVNVCNVLLYCIVSDMLCVQYINYQNWCEAHPIEEGEN